MKIDQKTRLAASCRRLQFELSNLLGLFWIIEKTPGLYIQQPWREMYRRKKAWKK